MGVSAQRDEQGLLWVEFTREGRRPPLLTPAVFDFLKRLVKEVREDPPSGIVFTGEEGGDFQAGVDLSIMAEVDSYQQAVDASRTGQLLFQQIADLPCPTVAAVEGRCIGGGTELSLACTARVAADTETTAFMLPEIHLGILCGYGGTQRLPQLIGQRRALQMILTGLPVLPHRALEWGLIDRIASPGTLRSDAVQLIADLRKGKTARRGDRRQRGGWRRRGPVGWFLDGTATGRRIVRNRSRRLVLARTGGHFPAPEKVIEAVGYSADGLDLERGLELEAEMLGELVSSDVHPHLLRLVRARQSLRRPRGAERESGDSLDLAEGLEIPAPIASALREELSRTPGTGEGAAGNGDVPALTLPGGTVLLRRLPCARRPGVIEAAWLSADDGTGAEAAGGPGSFQDVCRHAATAAGYSVVYCRQARPSPGLSLAAAYLREGDRLVAEGWEKDRVDGILREWGMEYGPFALAARLGEGWLNRLQRLPSRHLGEQAPLRSGDDGGGPDERPARSREESDAHLVEEVAAALVLEMSRLWEMVLEPTEEGWLVLAVFALGGPSYCGGVVGAARRMGADRIEERLHTMEQRWGGLYRPDPLTESGLLASGTSIPTDRSNPQEP